MFPTRLAEKLISMLYRLCRPGAHSDQATTELKKTLSFLTFKTTLCQYGQERTPGPDLLYKRAFEGWVGGAGKMTLGKEVQTFIMVQPL